MEKIYKARWWDYSQKKFNINGRVCLGTIIPFGLLGLLITWFVHSRTYYTPNYTRANYEKVPLTIGINLLNF